MTTSLLVLENVTKRFPRSWRRDERTAVAGVDLTLDAGEALGLVGASGAGKSTIARIVAGLLAPDEGRVLLGGDDLRELPPRERGRRVHLIFQDPYSSLAPHMRVRDLVAEPLAIHGRTEDGRIARLLREVQLTPADRFLDRRPGELSGGERQRVALARALALEPELILADEPTQMLDASLRADLVALMDRVRRRHGTAFLYVTHDLALAASLCDRLAVVHAGRLVEEGPTADVLADPRSVHAAELVAAVRSLHAGVDGGSPES